MLFRRNLYFKQGPTLFYKYFVSIYIPPLEFPIRIICRMFCFYLPKSVKVLGLVCQNTTRYGRTEVIE